MASGTKLRLLSRLLDASTSPCWVIDPTGSIAYVSGAAADWLGVDADQLMHRQAVCGIASTDPIDAIAASLAPPPSLSVRGHAVGSIEPPPIGDRDIEAIAAMFVRVGDEPTGFVFAAGGQFDHRVMEPSVWQADELRRTLDRWRKQHAALATIATAGVSALARRLRARLQVAAATRTPIGLFSPPGSGAESIAMRVHQLSCPGEPIAKIEGPLMDAELLDATLSPLIGHLAESERSKATALVRSLDEMPGETQHRLAEVMAQYGGRLRLIALGGAIPTELVDVLHADETDKSESSGDDRVSGIQSRLIDLLSALVISISPLASRAEDIPLLAAASLDARHAAGEGSAQRLSQQALDAMVVYPWPGNFQELDEAMAQAIRRTTGESILAEHLPLAIRSFRVGPSAGGATAGRPQKPTRPLDEQVRQYELRLIHEAVEAADGNRAEAARRLGISRARLLRRIAGASDE